MNRVKRIDATEERIRKLEDKSKEIILNSANGVKKKSIKKSLRDKKNKARTSTFFYVFNQNSKKEKRQY